LENKTGTAPGIWFEKSNTIFVSMPGVPHEMKYLMTQYVLPALIHRFTSQVILHKNIMTYGLPEARLAEVLSNFEAGLPEEIRLAYLPSSGVIKLRLTATGKERDILVKLLNNQVDKLHAIIPEVIYAENEETLEMVIGQLLKQKNKTVCTAESCTGGAIAKLITSVPGSSGWFKGSIVAYSNDIKTRVLAVHEDILKRHGAVSSEVVCCMATAGRKLFGTDYSIATSGIAGPDGATDEKPVGTVWVSVASGNDIISEKFIFGAERQMNIRRFSLAALNLLRKQIIAC
jgi:nicotinamide-nucleotide amidase